MLPNEMKQMLHADWFKFHFLIYIMAAVALPTKFVKPANSHLVCSVCKNVYSDPVINIKCGHTFCRACVLRQTTTNNVTKCPVDAITCDLGQLVINRWESQILSPQKLIQTANDNPCGLPQFVLKNTLSEQD